MSRDARILAAAADLRRCISLESDARTALLGRVWPYPGCVGQMTAEWGLEDARERRKEAEMRVLIAARAVEEGHADGPGA